MKKSHRNLLIAAGAAALLGYLYLQSRKNAPDALSQAAALQASGQQVPVALKQQIAREHL